MTDIELRNISKTYEKGQVKAVDDVTFSVNKGELFGLIGPDGAGKTSILRMLTTLLLPDSGNATVNGLDIVKDYKNLRQRIGYMPGRFSLYQDLTVEENLHFFATLFNTSIRENYELIREIYVQIEPFKNRRAGNLSGGMKQKLALCCALIHKPEVLFLDEPTSGIDAVSRKELWHMLKGLKEQEITILVSTPYMDEATLCDKIALIQTGKILLIDTPANIVKNYEGNLYAIKSADKKKLLQDLNHFENTRQVFSFGDALHFTFLREHDHALEDLQKFLKENNHEKVEINQIMPTIEDIFIQLMSASLN